MKKVLSYVVRDIHPSNILLELLEKEAEICFMFGVYGCLELLYENAHKIEPMTELCTAHAESAPDYDKSLMPKNECDSLGIAIEFTQTLSITEIDTLNDLIFPKHHDNSKFLLMFNFKNDETGHVITLRIEGDYVLRYCSVNKAIKQFIIEEQQDPGLKCSKENIIGHLTHFLDTQQQLEPETLDVFEIRDLFKKNKKLKTNYI